MPAGPELVRSVMRELKRDFTDRGAGRENGRRYYVHSDMARLKK
jgi:hypothetical protein